MRRAAIVGGGIAGLSCAYELARAGGWEPRVFEAGPRLGGKIRTERVEGAVVEGGPDSFVTVKPDALELVRELGLEGELVPTAGGDTAVYAYTRGRLRRFPDGLMLMAPTKVLPFLASDLVPWSAKLRMGLEPLVPRGPADADESLGAFARRRLGEEALEVIVGPVMAGIYSGDPDRLSLRSTFPQFCELERKYGSLWRGLRAAAAARPAPKPGVTMFMTLRDGLARLVDALAARLPGGCARTGTAVAGLEPAGGRWRLALAGGERWEADAVVLAAGARAAAALLGGVDPALAEALKRQRCASTATVTFLYEPGAFGRRLSGFGFVVDRREARTLMAATYSSAKFPGRPHGGLELVRCFAGGVGREETAELPEAELAAAARRDLARILGKDPEPRALRVFRWPKASPQYEVGHEAWLRGLETELERRPGLRVAGASYHGVGLPDCVRSGRAAARDLRRTP